MANSNVGEQPRKLIDRRRVVEMKMQEDEALFNNIMRAIEPCFQLVANRQPETPETALLDSSKSRRLSGVKKIDGEKVSRSNAPIRHKPYSRPGGMKRLPANDNGDQTNKGPSPVGAAVGADPMVRVSVIKHAPASTSPPANWARFKEPPEQVPVVNPVPIIGDQLMQLYTAGLVQNERSPWTYRCSDRANSMGGPYASTFPRASF